VDQAELTVNVVEGFPDVLNNSLDMMGRLCANSAVASLGSVLAQTNAPRLEYQMDKEVRAILSDAHVQDADNVRTPIAALLQCEDLTDRPSSARLARAVRENLDIDGNLGSMFAFDSSSAALEPTATIKTPNAFPRL